LSDQPIGQPPEVPEPSGVSAETGETSGSGGTAELIAASSPRPYGGYFDDVTDALTRAYPGLSDAVERSILDRGELTLHVRREKLRELAQLLRDDEELRFELLSSVSGVHYPLDKERELHAIYQITSLTHNRRIRLEVTAPDADPHIPSVVAVWPTADFQERETWDLFGIVFDGHPALTRIMMPDDWPGHPQRKDYPLGGIPVEYKGATIPPPEERRQYA
jgi:NADH-quinone oxidoreductase subunit C